MIVRKLEEKDIAKCLEIYNYYIENTCFTFEEEKLSLESFKKRCEGICEKYPYIVLENDGEIIGYAYLNTFNPRSAYRITADLSVYVSKDHLHEHAGVRFLNYYGLKLHLSEAYWLQQLLLLLYLMRLSVKQEVFFTNAIFR